MSGGGTAGFLGVTFDVLDEPAVLAWIDAAAGETPFRYVVTPNVDHVVMLAEDGNEPWRGAYRDAVADAALTINDSRILQRLARLSGKNLPVTPGSDIVRALVRERQGRAGTVALVGGRVEEADWLRRAMPHHTVLHHQPPMGVRDDAATQQSIARFVEDSRAELALFAIGAPQSEIVCRAIALRRRASGLGLCIGASVEFLSGAKRRAPTWMQKAGLEWLFRLANEPTRLWHRYLVRGPRVFALWWMHERGRA